MKKCHILVLLWFISFLTSWKENIAETFECRKTLHVLAHEYQKCDYKVIKQFYWTTILNTCPNERYRLKVSHMRRLYIILIMLPLLGTLWNSSFQTAFRDNLVMVKKISLIIVTLYFDQDLDNPRSNHPLCSQDFGHFQKLNPPLKDEDLPLVKISKRMWHNIWKHFRGVPKMFWEMVMSLQ